jgi:arylsulfatase A
LAKGRVPSDRKIDGVDLAPVLLGTGTAPPHEAYYYFNGQHLEAVRSGAWKLFIDPGPKGGAGGEKNGDASKGARSPRLYNLETDIGETSDVAADNPEVVKRLHVYIADMDADLGVVGEGPGVRKHGHVDHPKPLQLPTR